MIYLAFEFFLVWNMRNLSLSASAHGNDDAVKSSVAWIIHNPPILLIFVELVDFDVELSSLLETVPKPELVNLADNLLTIWITLPPLDRRVEAVHETMNLQT